MSQDIVKATSDLYGNVSFKDKKKSGGGSLLGRVQDALTRGRANAVARGGGYSDGGNWRTALDVNRNGSPWDEVGLIGGNITGGFGALASRGVSRAVSIIGLGFTNGTYNR
jgi:hypothetical protein